MKVAHMLFYGNVDTSHMKFWFGSNCLDAKTLEQIWEFLNNDFVLGQNEDLVVARPIEKKKPGRPKKADDLERAYKRQQDIDAIKKAVADRSGK